MTQAFLDPQIPSPCYVVDEAKLEANLRLMSAVQQQAGIDIILALKGFALWPVFPLVAQYLQGATASSVWEAKLARELGKEVHAYSPAYKDADIEQLAKLCHHLSFNSLSQWRRYGAQLGAAGVSLGIRINPEHREAETELYDPSAPGSRLGVRAAELEGVDISTLEGFHVHNLCECDSHAAERTLAAVERGFGRYLSQLRWLNLGGGHLMTREGYDVEHLITVLRNFKAKYPNLRIIMEPGSAVAWQTGALVCEVVDLVHNQGDIAILDISATAHMPDVLEMPYRPVVDHADIPGKLAHDYRLAGNSCLAGDVIGGYSFAQPLTIGQRLVFMDMIHYTMVKTTFFNGVEHPGIGIIRKSGQFELLRRFDYADFKARLG